MNKEDRANELKKLKCPKCGLSLVIYDDGLACSDMKCGGLISPTEIRSKLTLKSLKKEFPELRVASGGQSKPPQSRERTALSKQPKSIEGQSFLFDNKPI